jgi:serpin B
MAMKPVLLSLKLIAGLALCQLAPSCSKSVPGEMTRNFNLTPEGPRIVESSNQFAFDYLKAVLAGDPQPTNKLISPLSIYLALAMVSNGAGAVTLDSIWQAMRLGDQSLEELNHTSQCLLSGLPAEDNRVSLYIANSIWYDQALQPIPAFLNTVSTYYRAGIRELDLKSPGASATINNWIANHTNGKIDKVVGVIDPASLLFLINALYFKGSWKSAFNPENTKNGIFTTWDNQPVSVPFMMVEDSFRYLANDTCLLAELPYGGGNFTMDILLPNPGIRLETFSQSLSSQVLSNWSSRSGNWDIRLFLPKFKFGYRIPDMKPSLSSLGMGICFGEYADFSKMYSIPANISQAIHGTYIEVDESGAAAAAVTSLDIAEPVFQVSGPIVLNINHPFLFVIREKNTGVLLFLGLVNNPSQTS